MSEFHRPRLSAALIYTRQDPLNFKHLATTLNLILEPAKIRFRVIHERPGSAAVLSCRKLHISLKTTPIGAAMPELKAALTLPTMSDQLRSKLLPATHTIEVVAGTGPLPNPSADDDTSAENLLPLVGQMVVNHLLNMNPAEAVFWGGTNSLMTPKAFLQLIHAPMPTPTEVVEIETPKPPRPPRQKTPDLDNLRQEVLEKRRSDAASRGPASSQLHPSLITPHLSDDSPDQFELSDHIRKRIDVAWGGPKAAFVVSLATMAVAPLIGVLLLVYNFMGGARLRQTALLACLTAAVTLTAELVTNSDASATVQAPETQTEPDYTARL